MAILPFSEKISTDDWSTKMSIVAVLPVTIGACYVDLNIYIVKMLSRQ